MRSSPSRSVLDLVFGLFERASGAIRNLGLEPSGFGFGRLVGDYVALSVAHPTLGPIWMNVQVDGPLQRIVVHQALHGRGELVPGLGMVGLHYFEGWVPFPPDSLWSVVPACE